MREREILPWTTEIPTIEWEFPTYPRVLRGEARRSWRSRLPDYRNRTPRCRCACVSGLTNPFGWTLEAEDKSPHLQEDARDEPFLANGLATLEKVQVIKYRAENPPN